MKVGDLVRISRGARTVEQHRHLAHDDIGYISEILWYGTKFVVKWFRDGKEISHYRYHLRFAK